MDELLKDLFTKNTPKKKKYATIPTEAAKSDVPEGIMTKCPSCKTIMYTKELTKNMKVCYAVWVSLCHERKGTDCQLFR